VVGGGVAGLEAARVAAERGHQVTLIEASNRLGGQFDLASLQPRRGQIGDFLDWYARQLEKLQVKVLLDTYFEPQDVEAFGADEVILATGSQPGGHGFQRFLPHFDKLPGVDRGNVWTAEEVMSRQARLGPRVIVLDEGANWKGGGTALHIAEAGHRVTVVTPAASVMMEMARTNADVQLRQRLRQLGAVLITEAAIREWHGDAADVTVFGGKDMRIEADSLVLSTTNSADTALADALSATTVPYRMIGDAVAARTAVMAIYEGRKLAMNI
jgi:NADPH-dependent 2,4-dienoyl-CoA reductase/sulfur reductase-like enzyme